MQLLLPLMIAITLTYQMLAAYSLSQFEDVSHDKTGTQTMVMHHKLALNAVSDANRTAPGHPAGRVVVDATMLDSSIWETRFYPEGVSSGRGWVVTRKAGDTFSDKQLAAGFESVRRLIPTSPTTQIGPYEASAGQNGLVGAIGIETNIGARDGEVLIVSRL